MRTALTEYYYQFHHHQHYFLCHDILEEAWKEKVGYRKTDHVVSLILLATGCYHYRRGNIAGGKRSIEKAYTIVKEAEDLTSLGIDKVKYLDMLTQLINDMTYQRPFKPVAIPVLPTMHEAILNDYPDYTWCTYVVNDAYIRDHHKLRDRSEVINARTDALRARTFK